MRTVEVVADVIQHDGKFLLRYNEKWGAFSVPSTKRRENEALEEAARRTLYDDLGVHVDEYPPILTFLKSFRLIQRSRSQDSDTQYDFRIFTASFGTHSEAVYSGLRLDASIRWLTASQITDGQSVSLPVSETAERIMLRLLPEVLSSWSERLPSGSVVTLLDHLRRGMCTACETGLTVLTRQSSSDLMVHANKSDTLTFDYEMQTALQAAIMRELNRVAKEHSTAFDAEILGEEQAIKVVIGDAKPHRLLATLDPVDGSSNYAAKITSPARYRSLFPLPDAGISLALQIPDAYGYRYVVGVAADTGTGTIFSANWTTDSFLTFINDVLVDPKEFTYSSSSAPRINLPFYANKNVMLMSEAMDALYRRHPRAKIYPGRTRSSIIDLIRLMANDCDAYVDIRALGPSSGAILYPWDICGMVPVLQGLGWMVCNERGEAVECEYYDRGICFIAANNLDLGREILEALRPLVAKYRKQ